MSKRNKPRTHAPLAPLVDIVVTTSGRFDCLEKCLNALEEQTFTQFKVNLVDGASPAEERIARTDLFEEGWGYEFETKRLQQNNGFPSVANEGARMGKAPLILFLSDDVVLTPIALDIMVKKMDDPTIGITGAKLLFPTDSQQGFRPAGKVQHIGLAVNIRGEIVHPLIGWDSDNPKCNISQEVFAVTGACFLIRRNLFEKAGGFDLIFGRGTYEDVNLCLTVRAMGSKIYIDTNALAYHHVGATIEKRPEFAYDLQGNSLIFLSRWKNSGFIQYDEWKFY